MSASKLDPERALIKALNHPRRKELLKLCLEAEEPKSPKGLALETHRGKGSFQVHFSNVSYHVRTLADYGALEIAGEEPRRGALAHFYRPTELVRETPWVLAALGLSPPSGKDLSIEEELRARIAEHVAERQGPRVHGAAQASAGGRPGGAGSAQERRPETGRPLMERKAMSFRLPKGMADDLAAVARAEAIR
ncbi:MAG: hypothetical protein ACTHNP_13685 [Solirubrobacterales bacterium]